MIDRPVVRTRKLVSSARHFLVVCICTSLPCAAQSPGDGSAQRMQQYLQSRVARNPNDASAWRMLGRTYLQAGERQQAYEALLRAVELDPLSAAAHFDFGEILVRFDQRKQAANYFAKVVRLAPDSEYADKARSRLAGLPEPDQESEIQQASYEIRRFDGSGVLDRVLEYQSSPDEQPGPLTLFVELGALYNSNVTLAPTSRGFVASEAASFQGFFNPAIEYRLFDSSTWRAGPTFVGNFNANERAFQDLNLQSYQPGAFVERSISLANTVLVPRVGYSFTHDEFDGATFGRRHAMTTSVTSFWDRGDTSVVYWTIDYTNFANDGVDPATTSRDGPSNSLGVSHLLPIGMRHLSSVAGGIDVQITPTDGTDFAFNGISFFLEAKMPITDRLSFILEGSFGYRDYYAATFVPSRNETLWHGGARLEQLLSDRWSLAAVFSYDRFDSKNALFAADRYIAGILTIFQY